MPPINFFQSIDDLAYDARIGFGDTLDYIWKAPEFIDLQERTERKKLTEYYSDTPATRAVRWELESRKLYRVFPLLMGVGNLFASASLFEIYLLQLAKLLEMRTGVLLAERGQGVQWLLSYFRRMGIDTAAFVLWPQVNASLKIRHCLMHASGLLAYSRDEVAIRQIVTSRTFLARAHRDRTRSLGDPMVVIAATPFGERLEITNYYAWLQTAYLRDYFLALCGEAEGVMHQPSTASVTKR